jgi:hypothetical protein
MAISIQILSTTSGAGEGETDQPGRQLKTAKIHGSADRRDGEDRGTDQPGRKRPLGSERRLREAGAGAVVRAYPRR